jgi:hypothetical protein
MALAHHSTIGEPPPSPQPRPPAAAYAAPARAWAARLHARLSGPVFPTTSSRVFQPRFLLFKGTQAGACLWRLGCLVHDLVCQWSKFGRQHRKCVGRPLSAYGRTLSS